MKRLGKIVLRFMPQTHDFLSKVYLWVSDFFQLRFRFHIFCQIRYLTKFNQPIKFLSVGSNDGFTTDPFVSYICKNGLLDATFIEPVPENFELLKSNYLNALGEVSRLKFYQLAISNFSGSSIFYSVSRTAKEKLGNKVPDWYNQLGSFNRDHITKHLEGILEPFICETEIETKTLNDFLIEQDFEKLDVLHIDAEGHDYKVISTLDLGKYNPAMILVENKHLSDAENSQLKTMLIASNYKLRHFRSDLMATKQETTLT
jgi:FkbM family methyltransferase